MNPRSALCVLAFALCATTLSMACKRNRLRDEPVVYVTTGPDAGAIVLRSALESFGPKVDDYEALKKECGVDPSSGISIDALEIVAQKRGLAARQHMETSARIVDKNGALPAIAVVDAPAGLDFWLLWRRESDKIVVLDPRRGVVRIRANDVRKSLHVHEMNVPASPEALASPVMVSRDGDTVHVRGAVVVTLARH